MLRVNVWQIRAAPHGAALATRSAAENLVLCCMAPVVLESTAAADDVDGYRWSNLIGMGAQPTDGRPHRHSNTAARRRCSSRWRPRRINFEPSARPHLDQRIDPSWSVQTTIAKKASFPVVRDLTTVCVWGYRPMQTTMYNDKPYVLWTFWNSFTSPPYTECVHSISIRTSLVKWFTTVLGLNSKSG